MIVETLVELGIFAGVAAVGGPFVYVAALKSIARAKQAQRTFEQVTVNDSVSATRARERSEEIAELQHRKESAEARARALRSEAIALAVAEKIKALPTGDIDAAAAVGGTVALNPGRMEYMEPPPGSRAKSGIDDAWEVHMRNTLRGRAIPYTPPEEG